MSHHPRLRVLFLAKWYPSRLNPLTAIAIYRKAKAVSRYAEVAVIYVSKDPSLAQGRTELVVSREDDITVIRGYFGAIGLVGKLRNVFLNRQLHKQAYRQLLELWGSAPDIVDLNVLARPDFFAHYLLSKYGIPYIITERWSGFLPEVGAYKGLFFRNITRSNLRAASRVVTVSAFLANAMKKEGLDHPSYKVIHNVVDIPSEFRTRNLHADGRIHLVHISILNDKIKNISGILKAVKLVAEVRQDIHLHIIGTGPDEGFLKRLAQKLNLGSELVTFHGYKDNKVIHEMLADSQILIVNSRFETFSIVPIEAMAHGKPVIVTDCGGPREYMKPQLGESIPVNDTVSLERAIVKMIGELASYKAAYLHRFVKENFSYEVIGKKFYDLYKEVLASEPHRNR